MKAYKASRYDIEQSCFYQLSNKRRLADLLCRPLSAIKALCRSKHRYSCWTVPKKNGGTRQIEAPHENLKAVQRRISDLLLRIAPPDFLMAPVKGRTYVDNAAEHMGAKAFTLLDIEDFFPSCTDRRVYWFFNTILKCSTDVAAMLKNLTTYKYHLPQGSPCSPILAYFSYCDMWHEMHQLALGRGCKLSVYADDITISGDLIPGQLIWKIKQAIHGRGLKYSINKERSLLDRPADITGVIVSGQALLLPNRQHQKLAQLKREQAKHCHGARNKKLIRQIRGRLAQASQIENRMVTR